MSIRIFLSGRFDVGTAIETAFLKRTGCKHRCFSYANLDKLNKNYNKRVVESLAVCEKKNVEIMLDSGAASLHNIQAKSKSRKTLAVKTHDIDTTAVANAMVKRYAKFCHEGKDKWAFYVTLDFKKHQPTIMKMQRRFEKLGLRPTPVYHGDKSLDWLNKYADMGYKLIGLGTLLAARNRHNPKSYRFYLDRVFDRAAKLNLDLHGLAITSLSLMTNYPWWSVDSATWTKTASFGSLNMPDFDKGVLFNIHVSEKHSSSAHSYNKMSRRHRSQIRSTVKELGFDFKLLATDVKERHDFNGTVFAHLSEYGIDTDDTRRTQWENLI